MVWLQIDALFSMVVCGGVILIGVVRCLLHMDPPCKKD